jgi:UDP-N-acetylglucosamine acyltransferase
MAGLAWGTGLGHYGKSMPIHPTAVLEGEIRLPDDDSVEIGPHAVLRGRIVLGPGCRIGPHACLEGDVELGRDNRVMAGAVIGGEPQDLSFDSATPSGVRVGDGNTFREHVTIHRSTHAGGFTRLGHGNYLMAGAHIGHDSRLGDRNTLANNVLLAGHVAVGSGVFLGGASVFHQFIRIGDGVMVQGTGAFSLDLPPYVIGHQMNELAGLNIVGLRRAGVPAERRASLKRAYELACRERMPLPDLGAALAAAEWGPEARAFLEFFLAPSRKGVCR